MLSKMVLSVAIVLGAGSLASANAEFNNIGENYPMQSAAPVRGDAMAAYAAARMPTTQTNPAVKGFTQQEKTWFEWTTRPVF